jgi:hypothetical protein
VKSAPFQMKKARSGEAPAGPAPSH